MKNSTNKWLEAAKILEKDALAKVKCPECNIGELMVTDELVQAENKLDRYLICNNCGKCNVITILLSSKSI